MLAEIGPPPQHSVGLFQTNTLTMRRLRILAIACIAFVLLLCAGVLLAAAIGEPLRSFDRLFEVKSLAERARAALLFDSATRAEYSLSLLDERLSDLAQAANTPSELVALARASASLDRAALAVAKAPESPPGTLLRARLARMGERASSVQASLPIVRVKYPSTYGTFRLKLATLRAMAADRNLPQSAFARLAAIMLPFPDDVTRRAAFVAPAPGEPAELRHSRFPLDGAHATLACASCHAVQPVRGNQSIRFSQASRRTCADCHQPGKAPDHPIGDCAACHTTLTWTGVRFDHRAGAVPECLDCHRQDEPEFHSRSDCASCHSAESWSGPPFDHVKIGLVDCQGCHASIRPAAHAAQQCSQCHIASDEWTLASLSQPAPAGQSPGSRSVSAALPGETAPSAAITSSVQFQHPTGSDLDCQGCHGANRPVDHYHGQCSQCHTAGTTWKLASFNHQGRVDCQGCHGANRPVGHYEGQCSQCHTAGTTWRLASFNHQGRVDCQGCHASNRPANHYRAQCSACHDPGAGWQPVRFDHSVAGADCQGCHASRRPANHYQGQCSACHDPGADWQPVRFDHALAGTDCQVCHASNRPANHYQGQCSACHDPGAGWQPVRFDHGVAGADCQACHASNRPANHYQGQCSACHDPGAGWQPVRLDHGLAGSDCQGCHASQRPANHYQGQCSLCHAAGSAWMPAHFDHSSSAELDCLACHLGRRPQDHFDGQCSACHNTDAWKPASFSHQAVGPGVDCQSCHESRRPTNHLQGQCSECHNAGAGWKPSTVAHSFPMSHGEAKGSCTTCHPSATREWSCFGCHNQERLTSEHREEGISEIVGQCLNCHSGGREHDD
jgi:hypothetical protein